MAKGQVGDAVDIMLTAGMARPSAEEVRREVARLFPGSEVAIPKVGAQELMGGDGRSLVREAVTGANEAAWVQAVREAVLAAPNGAAPGITGMRSGWLRDAVLGDGGRVALGVVAYWVEGLLAGGGADILRMVRLSLLSKGEKGGWRPLGVGETVANVAKRLALRALRPSAEERCGAQGQWAGGEDACRRWGGHIQGAWERGHSIVSVDVSNAFNCVERAVVVDCVRDVCPEVAPFVTWCLQTTTLVADGGVNVPVTRGVVQGDPLSPMLFALAMCRVLTRVVASCSDRGVRVQLLSPDDDVDDVVAQMEESAVGLGAYADDVVFTFRDAASAAIVAEVLEVELKGIGLELARTKTRVVPGMG
jgi:hypothetical protein